MAPAKLSGKARRGRSVAHAGVPVSQANARRRTVAEHKLHRRLRIMGGAQAGLRILSGRGETTRPMMEKVCTTVGVDSDGEQLYCCVFEFIVTWRQTNIDQRSNSEPNVLATFSHLLQNLLCCVR